MLNSSIKTNFVLLFSLLMVQSLWSQTHFNFVQTDDYYAVIINEATIDGAALQDGDEIGVFFNNNDTLVCAGAVVWPARDLKAWADDSQTTDKDGFLTQDTLIFKIWDSVSNIEFDNISALYLTSNGIWGNGFYAQVNLNAIPAPPDEPEIDIENNLHSFDFGFVNNDTLSTRTFIIQNEGNAILNISSVSISGADAADFSIVNGENSFSIAPDSVYNMDIVFAPAAAGVKNAILTISSDDADEGAWEIVLTGTGVEPVQTHFTFKTTDDYYGIVINQAAIDNITLQDGDEIGVFFDNNGTLICAGAVVWPATGISAWGDDSQTSEKDGFASGDTLVFKIWDSSDDKQYDNVFTAYLSGDGTWGNGASAQVNLSAFPTDIDPKSIMNPAQFVLKQNYPNPFNPQTSIEFYIPNTSDVTIEIYNISGQKIRSLLGENKTRGLYNINWDGKDDSQMSVSSGIYILSVTAGNFKDAMQMTLIK